MASKTSQATPAIVVSRYPTIPTIDWADVERAQVRGRELHADAVREAFSGLFRSAVALLSGACDALRHHATPRA